MKEGRKGSWDWVGVRGAREEGGKGLSNIVYLFEIEAIVLALFVREIIVLLKMCTPVCEQGKREV